MLNFHQDHKNLVYVSLSVFLLLSILIAVWPAYQLQDTQPLPAMSEPTEQERSGLSIYVAENCVGCHTQQVRSIEMDKTWGDRPSIASDYFYSKKRPDLWRQSPSLLGSERTGPDLTNVGRRQPSMEWHLLHLYNPRIVVKESIMPGYPWLFVEKPEDRVLKTDVVVPVPEKFLKNKGSKIIASARALDLVAYLQSLEQSPLPGENELPFIPALTRSSRSASGQNTDEGGTLPDGAALYMSTCAACHQTDGSGLAGAFPPLAGSPIVNDPDPELLVRIILQGYDARPEYAVMVGFAEMLTDEEIAAIANHERSSWGNTGAPITAEDVSQIRAFVNQMN